jgi:hypothetical protein
MKRAPVTGGRGLLGPVIWGLRSGAGDLGPAIVRRVAAAKTGLRGATRPLSLNPARHGTRRGAA